MAKKTETRLVKFAEVKDIMVAQGTECATSPEAVAVLKKNIAKIDMYKAKFDGVIPDEQHIEVDVLIEDSGSDMAELRDMIKAQGEQIAALSKKTDGGDDDGETPTPEEIETLQKASTIAGQMAAEVLAGVQTSIGVIMAKLDSGDPVTREDMEKAFDNNWEIRRLIDLSSTAMAKSEDAPSKEELEKAVEILTKKLTDEAAPSDGEGDDDKDDDKDDDELEKGGDAGFDCMDISPPLPVTGD